MQDENEQPEQQPEAQAEEQAPEEAAAETAAPEEPAAEEPAAEEPAPEEPAPEEPAPDEPAAEEPAAEEAPAEEAPAEPAAEEPAPEPPAEPPAEPPEVLTPKQRRKLARVRAGGPPGPERSPSDRARERIEARSRKAAERSRWRARRRAKDKKSGDAASRVTGGVQDGAARDGEAPEPGKRKVRQGVVVSNKGDKTITVRIDTIGRHRVYGRVIRSTGTLHAHDERNEAAEGDLVRVIECRPLSRTKRWRLVDVLEKAK